MFPVSPIRLNLNDLPGSDIAVSQETAEKMGAAAQAFLVAGSNCGDLGDIKDWAGYGACLFRLLELVRQKRQTEVEELLLKEPVFW